MVKKKIAVIGAGLGGLSVALRLSVTGNEVHVFEKNNNAGGKANEINKNGFRFDTGPSLLTMPFVLEELFNYASKNISKYLEFKKLNILCKYFYTDGTVLNAYPDINKLAGEIDNKTIDTRKDLLRYLTYSKKIYDLTAELFLFKSFSELSTFANLKALNTLLQLKKLDTHRTIHEANKSFFNDSKTIQLFDRYATYNGSNPYKAPATLNIIQHVEYNLGGYIVKNGIYEIPKALQKVAEEKGVQFHFNTEVKKINAKSKRVTGIETNNDERDFDIVISNADVNYTYNKLLRDTKTKSSRKYDKLEMSSSALVFYWGVNGIHKDLEIHNILFSENYEMEFKQLFEEEVIPNDPTVYIYISSKFNSADAPASYENWFVMINVPVNRGEDWTEEINKVKKIIKRKIDTMLKVNIDNKIIFEEILTPQKIEAKTNSIGGSIYGISSNNKMAAFLRQQNRSKDYKGLYFCGGSAHPGGGIPLVLLSGKITADLIKKYELN